MPETPRFDEAYIGRGIDLRDIKKVDKVDGRLFHRAPLKWAAARARLMFASPEKKKQMKARWVRRGTRELKLNYFLNVVVPDGNRANDTIGRIQEMQKRGCGFARNEREVMTREYNKCAGQLRDIERYVDFPSRLHYHRLAL